MINIWPRRATFAHLSYISENRPRLSNLLNMLILQYVFFLSLDLFARITWFPLFNGGRYADLYQTISSYNLSKNLGITLTFSAAVWLISRHAPALYRNPIESSIEVDRCRRAYIRSSIAIIARSLLASIASASEYPISVVKVFCNSAEAVSSESLHEA